MQKDSWVDLRVDLRDHKSTWHLSEVKVKTRWLVVLAKVYSVLGKQEER